MAEISLYIYVYRVPHPTQLVQHAYISFECAYIVIPSVFRRTNVQHELKVYTSVTHNKRTPPFTVPTSSVVFHVFRSVE